MTALALVLAVPGLVAVGSASSARAVRQFERIGESDLDDLLCHRKPLNQGLAVLIDTPALGWGTDIDRVEIRNGALPESMTRSMSRQAEAERERRSRIIAADGELQPSQQLTATASTMVATPAAPQLRLLRTIVEVAAERNSIVVLPFPVDLLRILDRAASGLVRPSSARAPGPAAGRGHQQRGLGSEHHVLEPASAAHPAPLPGAASSPRPRRVSPAGPARDRGLRASRRRREEAFS